MGWVLVGVGLNSRGEGLWLKDSKLLVQGMHCVTERNCLNWVFSVSCTVLILPS